jgi:streptogramin lyase
MESGQSRQNTGGAGQTGFIRNAFLTTVLVLGICSEVQGDASKQSKLLVSSAATDSILVYSGQTGEFIGTFASSGVLENPRYFAFGPDGNLYVASWTNHNVVRYNGQTGEFMDVFVTPSGGYPKEPYGIAFGPDGNLFLGEPSYDRVLKFSGQTGQFINTFISSGLTHPTGLHFHGDGLLYITNSSTGDDVRRYDSLTGASFDTFVTKGAGGLDGPQDLVFGPDGNVYISSYYTDEVIRCDGDTGDFVDVFVSRSNGGLSGPISLVFGPDGSLCVTSRKTDQILRYDGETGDFMDVFVSAGSGGLDQPYDLIFRDINLPPSQPTVQILPENPGEHDNLFASATGSTDPEEDEVTYHYVWLADGVPIVFDGVHPVDEPILNAAYTSLGQLIACTVTPHDGHLAGSPGSDWVTIRAPTNTPTITRTPTLTSTPTQTYTPTGTPTPTNALPSEPTVEILPSSPISADDLLCVATGSTDPEGQPVVYRYAWYCNGTLLAGEITASLSHELTRRGATYMCLVTPNDGIGDGPSAFDSVTVVNAPPTSPVVAILPEVPTPDDGLGIWIVEPSTDADDDPVDYIFEWYESSNGSTWNRRPELSGSFNPPFYTRGVPEISDLYTQIAEFWKVEVTPVDLYDEPAKAANDEKDLSEALSSGEKATYTTRILPDLDGDNLVGVPDLLFLKSVWGVKKADLQLEDRRLFFDSTDDPNAKVGLDHLLGIACGGWHGEE